MKITILTLFPEMFEGPFAYSIMKRAQEKGAVEIQFVNIREFGEGRHKIVDDTSYGGGVGMVMKVDVLHRAIEHVKASFSVIPSDRRKSRNLTPQSTLSDQRNEIPPRASLSRDDKIKQKVVLMTASGKLFNQEIATEYAKLDHLILICGHYEGIDERITNYIDDEISIGDFVLTGGELPSMLIADAVIRLIPGVLPAGAAENESFAVVDDEVLLEYPHYTNPRSYDGHDVPEVLLSGNHKKIAEWKKEQAISKTKRVRPELLKK